MKLQKIIIYSILIIIYACDSGKKTESTDLYILKNTGKQLTYILDDDVGLRLPAIFPFTDNKGNKFLTFHPLQQNKIYFYELYSGNLSKVMDIEEEGPNGVPGLLGYHIEDYDKIYLTATGIFGKIIRVDTTGTVLQKISYDTTSNGNPLVPTYGSTVTPYTPLVVIDNILYITQIPMRGEPITSWPVSCLIDTINNKVEKLPLNFPPIKKDEERLTTGIGPELGYSRYFDGTHFVYSFSYMEDIIVASVDHKDIRYFKAKSKYIDKINDPNEKRPSDMFIAAKRMCEAPFYGDLYYDPYRKVYYRIAYPETEMEKNEGKTYIEIWTTGRKRFSIIILDEEFNVIGETLFPDYIYQSMSMFVEEDGLYIRSNHFKNPDYDEDKLVFDCLELVERDKR